MRRSLLIVALTIEMPALVAACGQAPVAETRPRALAEFEPHLTRQLTPAGARRWFGPPDEETGSGLRIFVYQLRGGDQLWLSFPGDAPIVYAKLRSPDGATRELPLR